jgi:branched-chain amino acid transport system substrate-binding protein
MKKNIALSLIALVLVILFSLTCEKILFAVEAPMTGDAAAEGLQILEATKLAVKEINESGGVNGKELEFLVGDDQANANQAVLLAQKFSTNKDILAILGPNNSSCAIASLPIYEKAGIMMLSPTTSNPKVTHLGHKNFARIYITDDIQAVNIAKFACVEYGYKKIGIIWENTDFGKGVRDLAAEAIPGLGGKVLGDESFVSAVDRDFSSIITKFKGLGIDCVIFVGVYTSSALFMVQSRNLGYNVPVVDSQTHPKFVEIAGKAGEGFVAVSNFNPYDERPKQAEFIQRYKDFTSLGDSVGEWGAHAYDVVYVLKKAIEMGGTTREKLIEAFHNPNLQYDGITGFIKFNEYGDVVGKKSIFLIVKNGKFVNYELKNM